MSPACESSSFPLHDFPGINFGSTNVLADSEVREGIKKFTGWPTIPQVGRQAPMLAHMCASARGQGLNHLEGLFVAYDDAR